MISTAGHRVSLDRMDASPRVVVVEDDADVRQTIVDYLGMNGYDTRASANGVAGYEMIIETEPDAVILDRMLPGLSGDEVCRRVRAISTVPILMLTALGDVDDRIDGLEAGADDYLAKPFALRELQLRTAALLRRSRDAVASARLLSAGDFEVNTAQRRVRVRGRDVSLTAREYELLLYLMGHADQVLGREEILREAWGWSVGETSTVTVHVRRLREKIETDVTDPRHLVTEWGAGYRFSPRGDGAA